MCDYCPILFNLMFLYHLCHKGQGHMFHNYILSDTVQNVMTFAYFILLYSYEVKCHKIIITHKLAKPNI